MRTMILCLGWASLACLPFVVTQCASTSEANRGNLSEAVTKSSNDYKGERKVAGRAADSKSDKDDEPKSSCLFGWFSSDNDRGTTAVAGGQEETGRDDDQTPSQPLFENATAKVLAVSSFAGAYQAVRPDRTAGNGSLWGVGARLGIEFRNTMQHSLDLGYSSVRADDNDSVFGRVENVSSFAVGYDFRYYTTPQYTLIGLYLSPRVTLDFLTWTYQHPVWSVIRDQSTRALVDSTEITGDWVTGISPAIALGATFFQKATIRPTLELSGGVTWYSDNTGKSFENDFFGHEFFAKLALEVEFSFRK